MAMSLVPWDKGTIGTKPKEHYPDPQRGQEAESGVGPVPQPATSSSNREVKGKPRTKSEG
jgi:hypothetical protein